MDVPRSRRFLALVCPMPVVAEVVGVYTAASVGPDSKGARSGYHGAERA